MFAHPDRRGEPHPLVPPGRSAGGACAADLDEAYEMFPVLGRRTQPARRHALGRRAADALDGPGAGRDAEAAHRRRAVARPGPDHRRRALRRRSSDSSPSGTSLLIVEQQVAHALALCDRVVHARPRCGVLDRPQLRGRRHRHPGRSSPSPDLAVGRVRCRAGSRSAGRSRGDGDGGDAGAGAAAQHVSTTRTSSSTSMSGAGDVAALDPGRERTRRPAPCPSSSVNWVMTSPSPPAQSPTITRVKPTSGCSARHASTSLSRAALLTA